MLKTNGDDFIKEYRLLDSNNCTQVNFPMQHVIIQLLNI